MIVYGGYFYFAPYAALNFLERELGLKRGVSLGQHFPSISIHGSQIRIKVIVYGVNYKINKFLGLHFKQIVNGKLRIRQPCQKSNIRGCQISKKVIVYGGYDKNIFCV